ncbi:hypothetical protein, conserved [Angomonas deanei]|uniref:Uncharacterized protein n=1 Tax=Angomonas deanei TaxID=59799 RepID=A0A7G2CIL7_9TRYP|nr:hypothetical protein, conserved [Angomonas deanei]
MTRQSERTKSVVADVPEHILKQESHVDKNDPSVDPVRGSLHGTPAIPADPTVGKSSVNYLQGPDSYGNTSVSPIQGNMTSSPMHGNTETNSIEVGAMPVSNLQTRYSNAGDVSAPSIHGNMASSPLHGNTETNSIEVGAMPVSYLQTRYSNAGDVSAPSIHGNMVASPIRSPQNATAADAILGRVPEYNLTGKYPEAGINSVNSVHATLNQSSSTLEKL